MIITLDGPAGAGKSSVARDLARRLGFRFLDTGAMYRAVALAAIRQGVPWSDGERLASLARTSRIQLQGERVLLDGQDVSQEIRRFSVTSAIHHVADNPQVREHLVELQRHEAEGSSIVTEGRDQGTVVFPDAHYKFFLTASPEERARRRLRQLEGSPESPEFSQVLADIRQRDARDEARPVGRLMKAPDAREILSDGMSREDVVDLLERIVRQSQSVP